MEYKPNNSKEDVRIAQRDMYATNTISLHRRPCIGIDIAGGNVVAHWQVTAMAYFENPREIHTSQSKNPLLECSEMYCGQGLGALFAIAVGLRQVAVGWLDKERVNEERLGPVVADMVRNLQGVRQSLVSKPNLKIVQEMFDPEATKWESKDGGLTIVETTYVACNWKKPVSCAVFFSILAKLSSMHDRRYVHGDILLANLLYQDNEGFLLDFDFVGHDLHPCGLRPLRADGKRHEDVNKAIEKERIGGLPLAAEHDRFSLGEV
eukprot:CAMPEP_0118721448 /NCGR_PEP_ID=MMETSP0800-20121206/30739_1 /TAXON_ID=210618 ORGANISM="Striatella unipunctata, Strain CCMP2910" /NCGR_SAMPLE_ID=MMETSP0800 /ASSEMBLY_ACC=CAM_ASM_000638 /LENGTH=263 /DNA_ID=CAMNT_0006629335 /DNA_START=149 /DNA_END=938 /DNA_ORIENTATION=+